MLLSNNRNRIISAVAITASASESPHQSRLGAWPILNTRIQLSGGPGDLSGAVPTRGAIPAQRLRSAVGPRPRYFPSASGAVNGPKPAAARPAAGGSPKATALRLSVSRWAQAILCMLDLSKWVARSGRADWHGWFRCG